MFSNVFLHSFPVEDSFEGCICSWKSIVTKVIMGCSEHLKNEYVGQVDGMKFVSTINHLPRQKFIFIQAVVLLVQSVVLQLVF